MNIKISPKILNGTLPIISSKSDVHRIMICAALSDAPTVIKNVSLCDDIKATAACIEELGAKVEFSKNTVIITPSEKAVISPVFNCNESGSTLRFLLPVCAAKCENTHFTGCGRLPKRPLSELVSAMQKNGVEFSDNKLPFNTSGKLKSGEYSLPGNVSSQYISGLLMALCVTEGESTIKLTSPLESASYVKMTLNTLKLFNASVYEIENGYKIIGKKHLTSPKEITAEGDWSNAAFFLVSAAISGEVTLTGLNSNSLQGDKKIIQALQKFNAHVTINGDAVTVSQGNLKATEIDLTDTPDMLPILAVLASFCEGESEFFGAKRLKLKESDRLLSVASMINSLGGKATVFDDGITVLGTALKGGRVNSENDHRIVMAAAVAACHTKDPVEITGSEAVNKSYPTFFEDFKALGGQFNVI